MNLASQLQILDMAVCVFHFIPIDLSELMDSYFSYQSSYGKERRLDTLTLKEKLVKEKETLSIQISYLV